MDWKITVDRVLEILNLNNTFLFLGVAMIIISTFLQYVEGIKFGIITLVFGGIFRVLNIVGSAIPKQNKHYPDFKLFMMNVGKFSMYLLFLVLYLYIVNRIYVII